MSIKPRCKRGVGLQKGNVRAIWRRLWLINASASAERWEVLGEQVGLDQFKREENKVEIREEVEKGEILPGIRRLLVDVVLGKVLTGRRGF